MTAPKGGEEAHSDDAPEPAEGTSLQWLPMVGGDVSGLVVQGRF